MGLGLGRGEANRSSSSPAGETVAAGDMLILVTERKGVPVGVLLGVPVGGDEAPREASLGPHGGGGGGALTRRKPPERRRSCGGSSCGECGGGCGGGGGGGG